MMNNNTLIVFGSGVVLVVASLSIGLYYRFQCRRLVVGAARAALEQNPDLPADVVAALAQEAQPPDVDLRRGMLFLSLAATTVCLAVAIVLLSPACLSLFARLGGRSPVGVRLALRDLARYRARSGPALAAISISTLR